MFRLQVVARSLVSSRSTRLVTKCAVAAEKEIDAGTLDCINSIRFLAIDAVEKANSGHPGLPMGCAPMSYVLFNEFMKFNPKNPQYFNRDRFVLSAGHGCMLHYAMLHLTGYDSVKVRLFVIDTRASPFTYLHEGFSLYGTELGWST